MDLNLNNLTFIIVTYNSEEVINNCLDSIPKEASKIVIENSKNIETKKYLENKYDNIKVILSDNDGMGASNNKGIVFSKTQFVFIINPDTTFKKDTLSNIFDASKLIDDFAIIAPANIDLNYPNYQPSGKEIDNNIIEAKSVDGFSMLINKTKFEDQIYFDENFFLYLENTDLCMRQKSKKEKIYIIKNSEIKHIGSYTTKLDQSNNLEYIRNWHWMWSKFYFNKKHYGYIIALLKTFNNLASASLKYLFYSLTFNRHKRTIYKMRILGLVNSMIGKKSYLRPKN